LTHQHGLTNVVIVELSALYLPQFHPIAENNAWWGEGFTEWTNVRKARSLFRRHHQPIQPGELGYYSLLEPTTRSAQAALAREYGVTSFCYWHYWFAGRELLEQPLDEVLASGEPDFPFFVGWANQTWSGVWHGAPDRILIEQTYPGRSDHQEHFDRLLPAFKDRRYVTRDGRPVLLIFRPTDLPNPADFVTTWQTMAREAGLAGLYLVAWIEGKPWGVEYTSHHADGFDAGLYVQFPFQHTPLTRLRDRLRGWSERFGPARYRYAIRLPRPVSKIEGVVHASVQPNWDNTPRSQRRGSVIIDAAPTKFAQHLEEALTDELRRPKDQQMVVVKSWNEWAEGNYLEPDSIRGRGWLESIRVARRAVGLDGEAT
jgi:hypothetical protein